MLTNHSIPNANFLPTKAFSSIPKTPLHWLWQPRIPIGKITLLAGDPGAGKTSLLLDLAAKLSNGSPMPTLSHSSQLPITNYQLTPSATLLLSPDDNASDTLRPRLESLNANLDHIHTLPDFHSLIPQKTHKDAPLAPTPLQLLEQAIQSIPNLALLIIDPITHYLGLTDRLLPADPHDHPAASRSTLYALAKLAKKHRLAIVLTSRLIKKTDPSLSPDALQRTLGSLAFTTAPRSVLLLIKSPPNPNPNPPTHLLLTIKSNCSNLPNPIPLSIHETLTWHPEIEPTSLHPTHKKTGPLDLITQSTADWLLKTLAHGPVSAYKLQEDAKDNLISRSTLKRVKESLGIQALKQDWSGKWFWLLPNETRPLPEKAADRQLAELLKKMSGGGRQHEPLEGKTPPPENKHESLEGKHPLPPKKHESLEPKTAKTPPASIPIPLPISSPTCKKEQP